MQEAESGAGVAARSTARGLAGLGLMLALGMVISAVLLTQAYRQARLSNRSIEVSGFAQREIASDFAIWSCAFTARGATMAECAANLDATKTKVNAYLTALGAGAGELELPPLDLRRVMVTDATGRQTNTVEGYTMRQKLTYRSAEVKRVAAAAAQSFQLVEQGIELDAEQPSYYYSKLDDLKLEMLGEAAENARQRALTMTGKGGSSIGELRSMRQGVFQITAPYSNEISDYGINDTGSERKTIKAIVSASFEIRR